ncbi:hypothetical protein ANTPLA_LOCUS1374 [Anthophora plagiata]
MAKGAQRISEIVGKQRWRNVVVVVARHRCAVTRPTYETELDSRPSTEIKPPRYVDREISIRSNLVVVRWCHACITAVNKGTR